MGKGARYGQAGAIRWHHYRQSSARSGDRRKDLGNFQRSDRRSALSGFGAAAFEEEEESPPVEAKAPNSAFHHGARISLLRGRHSHARARHRHGFSQGLEGS